MILNLTCMCPDKVFADLVDSLGFVALVLLSTTVDCVHGCRLISDDQLVDMSHAIWHVRHQRTVLKDVS